MIPVYLKIKGLYSYQNEQEIDFKRLTDASLFGIFGPVGSGKSSILEAITYVLYGEIDRLDRSQLTYNLMNLNSSELYIDFRFTAGPLQTLYRFTVEAKRTNKFNKVKTPDRNQYQWMADGWMPTELEAEQILNLKYEDFKRSTIIPQGNFQEFIELKGKERTEMLQRIFQLDKFDIYDTKFKKVSDRNTAALNEVKAQLAQLGEATPELIEEQRQQLANQDFLAKKAQKELEQAQAAEQKWKAIQEYTQKLSTATAKLELLRVKETEFAEREATLQQYEHCLHRYKNLLDNQKNKERERNATSTQIEECRKRIDTLENQRKLVAAELQKWEPTYAQRDDLKATIEEYDYLIRILELDGALAENAKKLTVGQEFLAKTEAEVVEAEATKEAAVQGRRELVAKVEAGNWEQKWQDQLTHLSVQLQLQRFASELHDEAACPLCGSLHHPAPLSGDTNYQQEIEVVRTYQQTYRDKLKAFDQQITAADTAITQKNGILKKAQDKFSTLHNDKIKFDTEKEAKLQLLRWLTYDPHTVPARLELQKLQADKKQALNAAVAGFQAAETNQKKVEGEFQQFSGQLLTLTEQLATQQAALLELQNQLTSCCEEDKYTSIEEVKAILKNVRAINEERAAIDKYKTDVRIAQAELQQLQEQVMDTPYDEAAHQTARQQVHLASESLRQALQEKGKIQNKLDTLEKQLELRKNWLQEQNRLEIRQANLAEMNKLLEGKKFINYIATMQLQTLCQTANVRFERMTSQRLKLEVDEENNFKVRDMLNGGHIRDLKTLSGGQKFQAALALALALSDDVNARQGSTHNFFFLDEGFGSLDKVALNVVFDTLKSLRKENRIVGVISHVEELQQEIPVHLRIENTDLGSRIRLIG